MILYLCIDEDPPIAVECADYVPQPGALLRLDSGAGGIVEVLDIERFPSGTQVQATRVA